MNLRRVVITGMGVLTHYGYGVDTLINGMFNSIATKPTMYPVEVDKNKNVELPVYLIDKNIWQSYLNKIPNSIYKNLTPMATYACMAADEAIEGQNLYDYNVADIGISVASSLPSMYEFESLLGIVQNNPKKMPTSTIFRTLNNNVAFNLAKYLNVGGRVLSSSAACATSLQSIILGYETIKLGKAKVMICGGSEEYHPQLSRVFHKLGIASKSKCKPFQDDRDGIAVAEGAGIVILEEYHHARCRNATIYGEIMGTGSTFTQESAFSSIQDITNCMEEAFNEYHYWDYCLDDYRNQFMIDTHATGTIVGDTNELEAIRQFTNKHSLNVELSALKGYLGHSMAACGVIELIATLKMAQLKKRVGMVRSINNLKTTNISDEKLLLDDSRIIIKNSFGLGGINNSICVFLHK